MFKVILILLTLLITGCNQTVTDIEIKKAEKYCKDRGGIKIIDLFQYPSVVCWEEGSRHVLLRGIQLLKE